MIQATILLIILVSVRVGHVFFWSGWSHALVGLMRYARDGCISIRMEAVEFAAAIVHQSGWLFQDGAMSGRMVRIDHPMNHPGFLSAVRLDIRHPMNHPGFWLRRGNVCIFSGRMVLAQAGMVAQARMVFRIVLVNGGLTRMMDSDHPTVSGGLG